MPKAPISGDDPDVLYSDEELAAMSAEAEGANEPEEEAQAQAEDAPEQEAAEAEEPKEEAAAAEAAAEEPEEDKSVLAQFQELASGEQPAEPVKDEAAIWREQALEAQRRERELQEKWIERFDQGLGKPEAEQATPAKLEVTEDLIQLVHEQLGEEATREQAERVARMQVAAAQYAAEQAVKPLQQQIEQQQKTSAQSEQTSRATQEVSAGLKNLLSMEGTTESELAQDFIGVNPATGRRAPKWDSFLGRAVIEAVTVNGKPDVTRIDSRLIEREASALARRMELAVNAARAGNGAANRQPTTTGLSSRGATRPASRTDKGPTKDERYAAELDEAYRQPGEKLRSILDPNSSLWG